MGPPPGAAYDGLVTTLLTLVEALARDPEAKADYAAGPDAYLERHGFGDLSPADVNEAVLHASDTLPAPAAAQVDHTGGLDSVASVDPTSFHADPGGDYEGDLFGHDPGDGFDDDTDGVGDECDMAVLRRLAQPGREAMHMKDIKDFCRCFLWLYQALRAKSQSIVGQDVELRHPFDDDLPPLRSQG